MTQNARNGGSFEALLHSTQLGMAVLDADGVFLQVNDSLCGLLGRGRRELIGRREQDFTHAEDRAALDHALADGSDGGQAEKRFLDRRGVIAWTLATLTRMPDGADMAGCWIGQYQDITELRESRESIQQQSVLLSGLIDNAPIGEALVGLDSRFLRVNRSLCRILGYEEPDLLALHFPDLGVDAAKPPHRDELRRLLAGEISHYRAECDLRDRREHLVNVRISVSLLRDAAGDPQYFITQIEDISEQKRAEGQARHDAQVLADAQELAQLGSWELDPVSGRLTWSDELCRISGRPVGYTPSYEEFLAIVHPEDRPDVAARVDDACEQRFSDSEYRIVRPGGEVRHVHTRRFGRRGPDGGLVSVWGTTLDITDRVDAEQQLREAHDHAEAILSAMGEGYALTVDGTITVVNERLCELTGFSRGELVGTLAPYPFWPPDAANLNRQLRDRVVAAGGGTFEMTLIRADGSSFDAEITARPARTPDGSQIGFVNTLRDISARKSAEAEQQALREIAELVAVSPNPDAVFEVVSRSVQRLFGASSAAINRFYPEVGTGEVISACTADGHRLAGTVFGLEGRTASATVYRTGVGTRLTADMGDELMGSYHLSHGLTGAAGTPLNVGGRLWGALVVAFAGRPVPLDIVERLERFGHLLTVAISNAEAWDRLEHHARTDALTALPNQRTFFERLQRELAADPEDGPGLCLGLVDLDHFKAVNDTYGHQIGDAVLIEFARVMSAHARDGDLVARIGGEEFAWLLPRTGADDAQRVIEELRVVVGGHAFPQARGVTMSAGISVHRRGMTTTELMAEADRAMYQAKDSGRDAVRMAVAV